MTKTIPTNIKDKIKERTEDNKMHEDYNGNNLPKPFVIKNGYLCREVEKVTKEGQPYFEYHFVSSTTPIINKRFRDIESGEVNYNLQFMDGDSEVNRPVTAIEITQKREMLNLARFALDINDKNAINLVEFISLYMRDNRPLNQSVATRLGRIGNYFIHPQLDTNVELFIHDEGYQSVADSFETKGTLEAYQTDVFDKVKHSPMAMGMIYSALGSVLLHDMGVEPFITDLSGKTSGGKTSAQKIASSVWGNDYLVNEWNATKVAIERKASFLNSFPLFLDDTRKADSRVLNSIVYNHSGGRDKGRGNINSINTEQTWENILISTGETAITDFSGDQAGVAARVITLQDKPFDGIDLIQLNKDRKENYGTLGLAFLDQYNSNKEAYQELFLGYEHGQVQLAGENEVMQRIARPLALLKVTGRILNDIEGYQHNYQTHIEDIRQGMMINNRNIDKPTQLLEELLDMLDANRNGIGGTNYGRTVSKESLAIYKPEYLNILTHTVKKFLGNEMNSIVKQWYEMGYLTTNKDKTQKSSKVNGTVFKGYAIPTSVLTDLGYDFAVDDD